MEEHKSMMGNIRQTRTAFPDEKVIYPIKPIKEKMTHNNVITEDYVELY